MGVKSLKNLFDVEFPEDVEKAIEARNKAMIETHNLVIECKPIFTLMSDNISKIGEIQETHTDGKTARLFKNYAPAFLEVAKGIAAIIKLNPAKAIECAAKGIFKGILAYRRHK